MSGNVFEGESEALACPTELLVVAKVRRARPATNATPAKGRDLPGGIPHHPLPDCIIEKGFLHSSQTCHGHLKPQRYAITPGVGPAQHRPVFRELNPLAATNTVVPVRGH